MTNTIVQDSSSQQDPLARASFAAMARYVDEHFAEHVTAADIAKAGTVSRTRAYEIFREQAGTSPADYLTEHRIMCAEELLAGTDLPMADIARRCGFSSPSHFAKVYRERCGRTPSEGRTWLRQRAAHVRAKPFEGIAPAMTMQLVGMSYFPEEG